MPQPRGDPPLLRSSAIVPLLGLLLFGALAQALVEWRPLAALDQWVDAELNERATPWVASAMQAVPGSVSPTGLLAGAALTAVMLVIRRHMSVAALVLIAYVGAELLGRDGRKTGAANIATASTPAAGSTTWIAATRSVRNSRASAS